MRKLKILAGALILAAAAPAAAQYYGTGDIHARIDRAEQRFERDYQSRRIAGWQAGEIRQDFQTLRNLQRQYARNGYSQWEVTELQRRLDAIEAQMRGPQSRYDRDRYDDDDYRDRYDDRYDDRDDRVDDDDRWDDRNDRWDDRYRDRECPPGLERRNNGCVPPGQDWRYNDNRGGYFAVPERYRYQYRDTDLHYFRYRDGYIYQLDRRTGRTVNTIWVGRQ